MDSLDPKALAVSLVLEERLDNREALVSVEKLGLRDHLVNPETLDLAENPVKQDLKVRRTKWSASNEIRSLQVQDIKFDDSFRTPRRAWRERTTGISWTGRTARRAGPTRTSRTVRTCWSAW